ASTPETWGSLAAPASTAYSRGTPPAVLEDVVVLPFNHAEHAVARIEREAGHLAAVLVDPVPNRVGLVPARTEFLQALRDVTPTPGSPSSAPSSARASTTASSRPGFRGASPGWARCSAFTRWTAS